VNKRRKLLVALGAGTLASVATASDLPQSTQTFPNKPVRIIMGPAAGGPTDITGRIFSAKMADIWGQQVVVDNRPGAGNTIGGTLASKAPPRWLHAITLPDIRCDRACALQETRLRFADELRPSLADWLHAERDDH